MQLGCERRWFGYFWCTAVREEQGVFSHTRATAAEGSRACVGNKPTTVLPVGGGQSPGTIKVKSELPRR